MNLAQYDNTHYDPGAGSLQRILWYGVNATVFNSWLWPGSRMKVWLLRRFGARVGRGVVIKPRVNIKYPWNLSLADHVWIGEGVWIDSLARVEIGSNVCVSQEAYLVTGSHNYKDPAFGLIVAGIYIEERVWIGARSIVCPGVRVRRDSVLTVGGVLRQDSEEGGVYAGNPAAWVRWRKNTEDREGQ